MPEPLPIKTLGRFPEIAIIAAVGLAGVGAADIAARQGASLAQPLFWLGVLVIFVPALVRILMPNVTRDECAAIVVTTSLALYMVKVLHSPVRFTFYDEYSHLRDTLNVLSSSHLFGYNPLLPISPGYPGIETVTAGLSQTGNVSVFIAAVCLMAAARIVLGLSMFLVFELATSSARIAGLAALAFMGNPEYVFFSSQFSYKQLALPLAILALYTVSRTSLSQSDHVRALTGVSLLILAAVIVTHHLISYWLLGLFVAVETVGILLQCSGQRVATPRVRWIVLLFAIGVSGWLLHGAARTAHYLGGSIASSVLPMVRIILLQQAPRTLFHWSNGYVTPVWQRVDNLAYVLVACACIAGGIPIVLRWHRDNRLAVTLALLALTYPVALSLRLSTASIELSLRLTELVFLPLGLVVGVKLAHLYDSQTQWPRVAVTTLTAAGGAALILGGIIMGWSPDSLLPGKYIVGADDRSIESQGIAAARWTLRSLGPDQRIVADRTNRLLLGTYGLQDPITGYANGVWDVPIYYDPAVDPNVLNSLVQGKVRYVLVDLRMSASLPARTSGYLEGIEPVATEKNPQPIPRHALEKFDRSSHAERVFDSGDIRIYDVAGLRTYLRQP